MEFKQRFGLDYLNPPPRPSKPLGLDDLALPKGLREAVIAYSSKILTALNGAPDKTMHLFDIAKETSTRVDTLLPVTRVLQNEGYLERISEDAVGNDAFRLTDAGSKIAT
jgi:hypothetical protein